MSNLLHACTTLIIALKRCSKRDDGVYLPGYNQVTSYELMIASSVSTSTYLCFTYLHVSIRISKEVVIQTKCHAASYYLSISQ